MIIFTKPLDYNRFFFICGELNICIMDSWIFCKYSSNMFYYLVPFWCMTKRGRNTFEFIISFSCILFQFILCYNIRFLFLIDSMIWGEAFSSSCHIFFNNSYVLSSSKRGRLLAQGYNHPVLESFDDHETYIVICTNHV